VVSGAPKAAYEVEAARLPDDETTPRIDPSASLTRYQTTPVERFASPIGD
jgi:hypothetical protein